MDINQSLSAHKEHKDFLLSLKGVVGTGISTKRTRGIDSGQPCIVVFVKEKLPIEKLDASQVVPKSLPDGVLTDVIETGEVKILQETAMATTQVANRQRHRPVVGGISVSPTNWASAGTGGLIVLRNNVPYLLSNSHVIGGLEWSTNPVRKGDPIRQPALFDSSVWDGGFRGDDIGTLEDWIPISFSMPNEVDAAVARLTVPHIPYILGIGGPTGIIKNPADLWDKKSSTWAKIRGSGRTSGITHGTITAIEVTIQVGFGGGLVATFVNQIASTPLMVGGDSGMGWILDDNRVAGLGFAGSTQMSFANPIGRVFELLNLSLPSPVTRIEDLLPQLGEVIIWSFDNQTKTWAGYDSNVPERFRELRYLIPGNGYWFKVNRDLTLEHNNHRWQLWSGWNKIGWR